MNELQFEVLLASTVKNKRHACSGTLYVGHLCWVIVFLNHMFDKEEHDVVSAKKKN